MSKRRPTRHRPFLLIVLMLVFSLYAVPATLLRQHFEGLVSKELGHNATSTAIAIARFLEQDIASYRAFHDLAVYSPDAVDAAWYAHTCETLRRIKQETGADFVFTEKWLDGENIVYLLDAEEPGSENYSAPGTTDGISEPERKAFVEGVNTNSGLIRDPVWGNYLTGFSPIFDRESGRVLGLVGVDYSAGKVQSLMGSLTRLILLGTLLLTLLTTILIVWLADMRYVALETDYLTGLYSRHYHDKRLAALHRRAQRGQSPFCHAIMDVDYFKRINDEYGHQEGDEVLKQVARILERTVRASDCCARLGGDEFGFVFGNTGREDAERILERIRQRVAEADIRTRDGHSLQVTLSIGMVTWRPGLDVETMQNQADKAMYASKHNGRNRLTVAEAI